MNNYKILAPRLRGSFTERLAELEMLAGDWLEMEQNEGRSLSFSKIFLSDAQNQHQQLVESDLFGNILSQRPYTVVEQPPADGSKVTLLVMTSDNNTDDNGALFHSLRLSSPETRGMNSYTQTIALFEKYVSIIRDMGLDMKTHLVRTWIYIADIDVNYAGVVKARNDIFTREGLTADTHFIASTGIGGRTPCPTASVAIDFLTYPHIHEADKKYLQALDHLNPTHEYGVAFERGTRLNLPTSSIYYISGTASIDNRGEVMYVGDVRNQTARLLENIGSLLADGGATMNDIKYFIVYLRDFSDFDLVHRMMSHLYPHIPRTIVHAPVCRPQWLVEMECVAEKKLSDF